MSTLTVADIRARSKIDAGHDGCWHWQGAHSVVDGTPRIYTFDHERGEKRVMSGPKAVWNIAHGEAPRMLVYRRCGCTDCVNPVHHQRAASQAEIGAHIAGAGFRKGRHTAQRVANMAKGRASQGIVDTPAEVVSAIRLAPPSVTLQSLADKYGITRSTASRIRRYESRTEGAL